MLLCEISKEATVRAKIKELTNRIATCGAAGGGGRNKLMKERQKLYALLAGSGRSVSGGLPSLGKRSK